MMNVALTASSILFPLITFPYVSRILLPEGTGKVAFATSLVSYFALIAQLGIPTYGIRACAKVRDNQLELSRTAQELLIINLTIAVIVYIIFLTSLACIPRLRCERTLYVVVSFNIILNAIGMEWLYKGLEQYTYIAMRSVIFKLIALILMFALIHHESDYVIYGALSVFAASASNISNLVHARKYISLRPVRNYHLKKHFKPVVVFFAMSCAATICIHIDSTMLGVMMDNTAVGYYDAAVKVKTALVAIVTSLGVVLLPRSSYFIQQGMHIEFMRVSARAMNFILLLASPLMLFFIIFAKQSIFLLAGTSYSGAVLPMQCIIPTVLFIGITNVLGIQMLIPLEKERIVLCSEIAGAVADLTMNAVLIPIIGISGAALGTLAAEAIVFLVQFIGLKENALKLFQGICFWKIAAGLVVAAASSFWVNYLQLSNLAALLLAACLFFGTYGIVLRLGKEPLMMEGWKRFTELFIRMLQKR